MADLQSFDEQLLAQRAHDPVFHHLEHPVVQPNLCAFVLAKGNRDGDRKNVRGKGPGLVIPNNRRHYKNMFRPRVLYDRQVEQ